MFEARVFYFGQVAHFGFTLKVLSYVKARPTNITALALSYIITLLRKRKMH